MPTADPYAPAAASCNGTVAASFATTVGAIRSDPQLHVKPERRSAVPDNHPAALYFIDGQIPKAPPPLPSHPAPSPFDRAVIDGQPDLLMAGYRDRVPIQAP
jgi:hypothetical protein